jgi:transposase
MEEPPDHALGRSRGGFGTKVHLVCDSHGFIVAIYVTAGQAHESKAFEPTMAHRFFHRRRGQGRWPNRLAGDKGYSYPRIRRWCRRRRIEAVIPTRKDQPRDERFDRGTYRRRNIIEISHPHDVRNDTLYQPGQSGYRGCSGVTGTGTLVLQAA